MLVVISYDIENDRLRSYIAKKLKDFGQRVQKSVFEADISEQEYKKLIELNETIELDKDDSIRLYRICADCRPKIRIWGKGEVTEDKDFYIA